MKKSERKEIEQLISTSKNSNISVTARDPEFNRILIEKSKIKSLIFPSKVLPSTKLKKQDIGLNRYLAKLASKKEISIGIDLKSLRNLKKEEKAIQIRTLIGILKECEKTKCKISILNSKDKKDTISLLLSLGASTQYIKKSIDF